MTKDVLLTIRGMQYEMDSNEPIEVMCRGQYYRKNGKHYVLYEEMEEESDRMTKCTLKISPEQVDMIKKGASGVHMMFAKGQSHLTCYETPFGQMMMGINTRDIEVKEEESEIAAKLTYALDMNYAHVSDCEVMIRIRQV